MNDPYLYLDGETAAFVAVSRQCFAPSCADGFHGPLWQLCILQKVNLHPPSCELLLLLLSGQVPACMAEKNNFLYNL